MDIEAQIERLQAQASDIKFLLIFVATSQITIGLILMDLITKG